MNTSPDGLKVNQTLGASRDKAHNPMSRSRLLFQPPDTAPATPLQLANSDGLLSSLKRKLSDCTVDYPRRRATIACEVCRSRKSRCDGSKPKCKLCAELGAECVYREPGVKLDAGDKLILEQLNRIENLLQINLAANQGSGLHMSQSSPSISNGTASGGDQALLSNSSNTASTIPNGGLGTWKQRELVERIYWNTLLFESDLLAELDLPHSGVVQFEENVGLPGGFEGEEQGQARIGHDDLWYFLAEIALRRLLNRASQLIYSKDSVSSTTSLEPVVAELDYQLTQWYEGLPPPLQFPFSRTMLHDPIQAVLRLRFYACKTIIYRPYILAVLENEQAVLDPAVRECCHKCLEASVRQLEHVTEQ
ncbi:C6 finger domain protein [Metarhizium brunneum]